MNILSAKVRERHTFAAPVSNINSCVVPFILQGITKIPFLDVMGITTSAEMLNAANSAKNITVDLIIFTELVKIILSFNKNEYKKSDGAKLIAIKL